MIAATYRGRHIEPLEYEPVAEGGRDPATVAVHPLAQPLGLRSAARPCFSSSRKRGGTMLTDAELQAIRTRCEAATPGPWEHHYHHGEDLDDLAAFFRKACAYRPECNDLELVLTGGPDDSGKVSDDVLTIAMTGNGPTSNANADFIASARTDVLALLDEIARLRVRVERLDDAGESAHLAMKVMGNIFDWPPQIPQEYADAINELREIGIHDVEQFYTPDGEDLYYAAERAKAEMRDMTGPGLHDPFSA